MKAWYSVGRPGNARKRLCIKGTAYTRSNFTSLMPDRSKEHKAEVLFTFSLIAKRNGFFFKLPNVEIMYLIFFTVLSLWQPPSSNKVFPFQLENLKLQIFPTGHVTTYDAGSFCV